MTHSDTGSDRAGAIADDALDGVIGGLDNSFSPDDGPGGDVGVSDPDALKKLPGKKKPPTLTLK